jgi:hypothetical protein
MNPRAPDGCRALTVVRDRHAAADANRSDRTVRLDYACQLYDMDSAQKTAGFKSPKAFRRDAENYALGSESL